MKGFPDESIDLVMFSPPYYGLRNYGEATETVWGGCQNCSHKWVEERMTLIHENGALSPLSLIRLFFGFSEQGLAPTSLDNVALCSFYPNYCVAVF
jgi:hypothetical protein